MFFDGLAPKWDDIRSDVADSQRMLASALGDLGIDAPARILDVGTGTGQAAAMLHARYPDAQIDGVDASPQMIELARAKPELSAVTFAVADGGRLPYADGRFDLTVSLLVQPFEKELHRVLAPGGWSARASPRCAAGSAGPASGRPEGGSPGRAGHAWPRLADVRPWSGTEGDCRPRAPGSRRGHQSRRSMRGLHDGRKG